MNLEIKAVFGEEEVDDAALFLNGKWSKVVIDKTLEHIRQKIKYTEVSDETLKALEEVRECILDHCTLYGIPLS